MAQYKQMTPSQLTALVEELQDDYKKLASKGLKLDLSRGKPDAQQLDLSQELLDALKSGDDWHCESGADVRNYGLLEGIPEARRLMGQMLGVDPELVMVGGNSSLNLMHDCLGIAWLHGLPDSPKPWCKLDEVKFLCPSPGYDRHFAVSGHFGIRMVPVPMTEQGPDMDVVERLVRSDASIKGMWCIPKYSNPTGITYSNETVRRLANMNPAAPDFCIFYDNAYAVHHLHPDNPDSLLPILPELEKAGRPNMVLQFTSTSKVSFPGGGIAAMGASKELLRHMLDHLGLQTIGFDKVNQLRQARYFGDLEGINAHMRKHAALLLPKFQLVLDILERELGQTGIAHWQTPRGGYFISLDVSQGCAKRVVALCKEAGVVLTPAGATYPYGNDPMDSNIRIAPTFATLEEVEAAASLLCLCVKLAGAEKLLLDSQVA